MKNWKKQFALAMSVGCFFIAAPLIGQEVYNDPASCDPCNCNPYGFGYDCSSYGGNYPHFGVAADFLWWKPCVDRLDFATQLRIPTIPTEIGDLSGRRSLRTKHRTICPQWEPGVKVQAFASNLLCGIGIVGSWTYVNPKRTQCARGFGLFADVFCEEAQNGTGTVPAPSIDPVAKQTIFDAGNNDLLFSTSSSFSLRPFEKLSARWETSYHDWDVLFYRPCCFCDNQVWIPYIGLAGLVVNQNLREHGRGDIPICFTVDETDVRIVIGDYNRRWKSDLSAYGLRIGLKYEWNICGCLKLFGRADASVVAGDPRNHARRATDFSFNITDPETGDVIAGTFRLGNRYKDDKCYRCYPGYRLSAGLAYETCVCDMDVWARIGYEFVEWRNMPNQRQFFESINPALGAVFDVDDPADLSQAIINGLFDVDGVAVSLTAPSFNTTSPSDRTLGFHGLFVGLGVAF